MQYNFTMDELGIWIWHHFLIIIMIIIHTGKLQSLLLHSVMFVAVGNIKSTYEGQNFGNETYKWNKQ